MEDAWDLSVFHIIITVPLVQPLPKIFQWQVGSLSYHPYDKQVLLKAVLDGDINPGRVFTSSYKLEDIDQAYKDMDERKTIKSMIVMD